MKNSAPEMPSSPGKYLRSALIAISLLCFQLALVLILAPRSGPESPAWIQTPRPPGWVDTQNHPGSNLYRRYLRLNNWDSLHFWSIAQNGYPIPPDPVRLEDIQHYRASEVFFPSYPLAARMLARITGLSAETALLATAQGFCALFWFCIVLLAGRCGLRGKETAFLLITLAAHPAAFYLVCGYSESTFLFSMTALLLWVLWPRNSEPATRLFGRAVAAGAVGALMTGSRLVALPLAAIPMVQAVAARVKTAPRLFAAMSASVLASGGAIAFFAFCRGISGRWDLYFLLQKIGWANTPDYLAFLDPRSYLPRYFFEDTLVSIHRTSVLFSAFLAFCAISAERACLERGAWRDRAALYAGALALLYLSIAGKAGSEMDGMARYTLPVFVLLVLAFARLYALGNARVTTWAHALRESPRARAALIAAYLLAFSTQAWLAYRFLRGKWVS